ncbi:MAG TPA: hypothetical protein VIV11_12900 [Kofleriaceae bacterium]
MRPFWVLVLAACGGSERPAAVAMVLERAPDVQAHPDAEILIGVVGDVDARVDVRAGLIAQVIQRVPDVVIASSVAAVDEAFAYADHQPLGDRPAGYAFTRMRATESTIIVEHSDVKHAKVVIDRVDLGRLNGIALVRARHDALTIDLLDDTGVPLR